MLGLSRVSVRVVFKSSVRFTSILSGGKDSVGKMDDLMDMEKEISLAKSFQEFCEAPEPVRLLAWQRIHLNLDLKDDYCQSKIDVMKALRANQISILRAAHANQISIFRAAHANQISIFREAHAKSQSYQTQRYINSQNFNAFFSI